MNVGMVARDRGQRGSCKSMIADYYYCVWGGAGQDRQLELSSISIGSIGSDSKVRSEEPKLIAPVTCSRHSRYSSHPYLQFINDR